MRVFPTGMNARMVTSSSSSTAGGNNGTASGNGSGKTALGVRWRATFEKPKSSDGSSFADKCPEWAASTELIYGGKLLNEFVFFGMEGGNGGERMMGLEIPALRVRLGRVWRRINGREKERRWLL